MKRRAFVLVDVRQDKARCDTPKLRVGHRAGGFVIVAGVLDEGREGRAIIEARDIAGSVATRLTDEETISGLNFGRKDVPHLDEAGAIDTLPFDAHSPGPFRIRHNRRLALVFRAARILPGSVAAS